MFSHNKTSNRNSEGLAGSLGYGIKLPDSYKSCNCALCGEEIKEGETYYYIPSDKNRAHKGGLLHEECYHENF